MNPTLLARRRSERRRQQGGVAMFIVSMMMTVLATVGLFALAAASTEMKTAGNERQNTQTHYLAEYGVVAIAHEVDSVKVGTYLGLMFVQPRTTCQSDPIPTANPVIQTTDNLARACARVEPADIQLLGQWSTSPTVAYTGTAPYQASVVTPGSLGPVPTTAGFYVELTDPTATNAPPRYSFDLHLCFVTVTATSNGVTTPSVSGVAAYGDEGIEMQRARIVAGPTACPH
jgi:Tfp pilus assembly protein PilX